MEISKEFHDRLITELLTEYDVTLDAIDSTLVYFSKRPAEYEYVLEQVRSRLQDLSNKMKIIPDRRIEPEKKRSILPRRIPKAEQRDRKEKDNLSRERLKIKQELKKKRPDK